MAMAVGNGDPDRKPGNGGMTTGVMIACAVSLLALPSAVLALTTRFDPSGLAAPAADGGQPLGDGADTTALSQVVPLRSLAKGPLYPFTPAGTPNRPDRSVTVAVRVDPITVQAIAVRGPRIAAGSDAGAAPLSIAPTAFSLGMSRGYQTFAMTTGPGGEIRRIDMPDLSAYRAPSASGAAAASRFAPRIVMDEKPAPGRAPRTFAGDSEEQVDVGGSYRLTRNLNVTAGVRYSQDRERLQPLTDGNKDSQAVYVGTQFRF
jgi:hypothetical protein